MGSIYGAICQIYFSSFATFYLSVLVTAVFTFYAGYLPDEVETNEFAQELTEEDMIMIEAEKRGVATPVVDLRMIQRPKKTFVQILRFKS